MTIIKATKKPVTIEAVLWAVKSILLTWKLPLNN